MTSQDPGAQAPGQLTIGPKYTSKQQASIDKQASIGYNRIMLKKEERKKLKEDLELLKKEELIEIILDAEERS